ncbi:MAG: 16S rRNA (guanine(527)-N(7))-methyltransferase RsmG [Clostridiales bacterium]|nr:16S rRNA (guanine(527)-N(7))-methyltransferase RsmG [Clostridiales bacterium]
MSNKIDFIKETFLKAKIELDNVKAEKFLTFAEFLIEYNKKVNLTAIKSFKDIVIKHFVDSCIITSLFDIQDGSSFIDVGCGAGFPSIPMMIMRDDLKATLVDSNGKKIKFIRYALEKLDLNATLINQRSEDLPKYHRDNYDFAIARAVAALPVICELCLPYVKKNGVFYAMKGSVDELSIVNNAIKLLGAVHQQTKEFYLPNGDFRRIYSILKIRETDAKYPRNYSQILKRPL